MSFILLPIPEEKFSNTFKDESSLRTTHLSHVELYSQVFAQNPPPFVIPVCFPTGSVTTSDGPEPFFREFLRDYMDSLPGYKEITTPKFRGIHIEEFEKFSRNQTQILHMILCQGDIALETLKKESTNHIKDLCELLEMCVTMRFDHYKSLAGRIVVSLLESLTPENIYHVCKFEKTRKGNFFHCLELKFALNNWYLDHIQECKKIHSKEEEEFFKDYILKQRFVEGLTKTSSLKNYDLFRSILCQNFRITFLNVNQYLDTLNVKEDLKDVNKSVDDHDLGGFYTLECNDRKKMHFHKSLGSIVPFFSVMSRNPNLAVDEITLLENWSLEDVKTYICREIYRYKYEPSNDPTKEIDRFKQLCQEASLSNFFGSILIERNLVMEIKKIQLENFLKTNSLEEIVDAYFNPIHGFMRSDLKEKILEFLTTITVDSIWNACRPYELDDQDILKKIFFLNPTIYTNDLDKPSKNVLISYQSGWNHSAELNSYKEKIQILVAQVQDDLSLKLLDQFREVFKNLSKFATKNNVISSVFRLGLLDPIVKTFFGSTISESTDVDRVTPKEEALTSRFSSFQSALLALLSGFMNDPDQCPLHWFVMTHFFNMMVIQIKEGMKLNKRDPISAHRLFKSWFDLISLLSPLFEKLKRTETTLFVKLVKEHHLVLLLRELTKLYLMCHVWEYEGKREKIQGIMKTLVILNNDDEWGFVTNKKLNLNSDPSHRLCQHVWDIACLFINSSLEIDEHCRIVYSNLCRIPGFYQSQNFSHSPNSNHSFRYEVGYREFMKQFDRNTSFVFDTEVFGSIWVSNQRAILMKK